MIQKPPGIQKPLTTAFARGIPMEGGIPGAKGVVRANQPQSHGLAKEGMLYKQANIIRAKLYTPTGCQDTLYEPISVRLLVFLLLHTSTILLN